MTNNSTQADALHMAKVSHMVTNFAKQADDSNPMKGAIIGGLGGGVIGGIANMKARRDIENQYKTPRTTSNSTNFLLGGLLGGLGGAGAGYLAGGGAKNLMANKDQVQYLTNHGPKAVSGAALNAMANSEEAIQGGPGSQLISSMSERKTHPLSVAAGGAGLLTAANFGRGPLAHIRRLISKNDNKLDVDKLMVGGSERTYGTGLTRDKVNIIKTTAPNNIIEAIAREAVPGSQNPTPSQGREISSNVKKLRNAIAGKKDTLSDGSPVNELFNRKSNQEAINKAQRTGINQAIINSAKNRLVPSAMGAANIYQGGQLAGNLLEWKRLRNERRKLQG